MKRHDMLYRILALFCLAALAACSDDDFAVPDGGDAAARLVVTVTDGAYTDVRATDTRAAERGYVTEFTRGDRIGLYAVELSEAGNPHSARRLLHENLCLTYDGAGWTLPASEELLHRKTEGREILYFAYYPYQEDMIYKADIQAKDNDGNPTTEVRHFFRRLIYTWQPAPDQSTYEAYTSCDLMVSRGEVTVSTAGEGHELRFAMEHMMALAVFRFPSLIYNYEETVQGKTTTKSYRVYTKMMGKIWMESPNTGRYLVHPSLVSEIDTYYYDSALSRRRIKHQLTGLFGRPGRYRLYTIDSGKEVVRTDRPLKEGDFFMRDGCILPQEYIPANMNYVFREDCLGVVFWVGENEEQHWTKTGSRQGDGLLVRDHPQCNRAMVLALRDASDGGPWATGQGANEALGNWLASFSEFGTEEKAVREIIGTSDGNYGYGGTASMKLYKKYHDGTTFPLLDAIESYDSTYLAPAGTSGWFFPGRYELAMMMYGKTKENSSPTVEKRDFLNQQFQKAGGEPLVDGGYWSNSDKGDSAWGVDCSNDNITYSFYPKTANYRVRAVLAM